MEPGTILALTLGFSWLMHVWEQYLAWRQYCKYVQTTRLPSGLSEILSEAEFEKSRAYKIDRARFSFVHSLFNQCQDSIVLLYGLLPWLWQVAADAAAAIGAPDSPVAQASLFLTIGILASSLLSLPWSVYDTFVIEARHGFNKQTPAFFVKDTVKKLIVSIALMVPIVDAIVWIIDASGEYFFVYVWIFMTVVIFALLTIYPDFIAPLFDKYTPLPDGPLREKIQALAARLDFPLKKLYVVEGSKRSAHSNAYLYGFWKNKRIVLFNTLLAGWGETDEEKAKGMNDDQVVAVLGHELGHWSLYHTLSNLVIVEANQFLTLFLFGFLYRRPEVYAAFGFTHAQPTLIGLLIIFSYIFAPYNEVINFAMTALTRRMEFAADAFSAQLGYARLLSEALVKLGKDNLSFPVDDWLYSTWHHSHPPIPERVAVLRKTQ